MPASDSASETNSRPPGAEASPPSPAGQRRFPRSILLALVLVALVAGVGVVLKLFVARHLPELTEPLLAAAEARWEANGPANYDLDLELAGARPGVVHVEVRDGEVTAMSRDGVTPSQQRTWYVWSVPGQFETIERELELAEDPQFEMQAAEGTQVVLRAEFDPKYGYPRQFHRLVFGGGPEVFWRVTRFEPK
jgi:hypothetical protein